MKLAGLISQNKAAVAERWFDATMATYPPETYKLWRKADNQFASPVPYAFRENMAKLVDELVTWKDARSIATPLHELVKIRAIQDFPPAKAVSFVFLLKAILRELFAKELPLKKAVEQYEAMDRRIDNLALMAFDIYVKDREKLYEMRVDEFKRTHHMLFKKAGLTCPTFEELRLGKGTGEAPGEPGEGPAGVGQDG